MASKSPVPRDKDLYAKVKDATKRKFDVYPSIYANAWLVKEYKRRYEEEHGSTDAYKGKKNPKQGLPKWFKEQWVDLSRSNPDKDQWEDCGRPDTGETQADWKRRYPKCLPKAKAKKLWKEGGKDAWKDAIERKRKAVNDPKYKGGKPTYVKTKSAETEGEERWGSSASGILVVARDTGRVLLGLRSAWVAEPGTWGNFGGAIGIGDDGQVEPALSPADNALKELIEETGYRGEIELFASWTYVEPNFRYYNFIGVVPTEASVPLDQTNWEVERLEWFTPAELQGLPNLHFGVSELMSHETELLSFSADYVPAFSPEPRFVKFRDLPKTTQWDITYNLLEKNPSLEEYRKIPPDYLYTDLKTLDSLEFPVFTIPLSDIENVPSGRQSILAVMKYRKMLEQQDAPPILLTGEQFVDGIHRFLAYEMAHRYYIPALDLGNALTVDLREYLDTGKGDPIEWDVGEDSLLDFTFEPKNYQSENFEPINITVLDGVNYYLDNDNYYLVHYDSQRIPYLTLYHATTMDNFETIETFGLRPFQPGWYEKAKLETYENVEGIYFATDLEEAKKWIGWKYRESLCYTLESLEEDGYEPELVPNEVAGVVYSLDIPLDFTYDEKLKRNRWKLPANFKPDLEIPNAWYTTESIPREELSRVGFYVLPICFYQGWNDGGNGIVQIDQKDAISIHNRGFYIDARPTSNVWSQIPPSTENLTKYPWLQTPFTQAKSLATRYLPLKHITSPRESLYSGFRGIFYAEDEASSTLMTDWSELSPVELAGLAQFPSDDGHLDAWEMYIYPSETREKYFEVLDLAESEYYKMESDYREANGLKPWATIPWQDRKNLPFTEDEIYAKYFDFWYVPDCQYSLSGGGKGELSQSILDSLPWQTLETMAQERGIPFNESISFDQYRSYYQDHQYSDWVENNIKWAKERGRDKIHVDSDLIIQALIDERLSLPLEKIFYSPLLAAAPLDAEPGTDAGKGAGLIAGWHRDAYANILASQGRITGSPVVFFKPKEEFL